MKKEIERKWLIEKANLKFMMVRATTVYKLTQGYLNTEGANTMRIRIHEILKTKTGPKHSFAILTVKGKAVKGELGKPEFEYAVPLRDAKEMLLMCGTNVIYKKRFILDDLASKQIELDVFQKNLAGLIVAEVEFPSEKKAAEWKPPAWFDKEVTKDKLYTNKRLSVNQCVPMTRYNRDARFPKKA